MRSSALAAALVLLPAVTAEAQSLPCAARERVLAFVIDQRHETRLATGDASRGATIELYAGDSGSWTLLLNLPDGRSCLLANGENFAATGGLQPARGNPA
ncbi:MAG: hypothetical protein KDK12_14115 [Rhodobacteraceae bacterium]|nr:hypothetical protein [Paracoccaceae bacterium]